MRVAGWVWVGFTKETVVKRPTARDSMETASYVIGRETFRSRLNH
jgi:hypothetical protein